MKRLFTLAAIITIFPAGYCLARSSKTLANFSGTWVLDMAKTHNVPRRLQSLKMNVTQTTEHMIVNTEVKGDFRPEFRRGGEQDGGGLPGGSRDGGGFPGGGGYPRRGGGFPGGGFPGGGFPGGRRGSGFPGGPGGRSGPGGPGGQVRKSMAFAMISPTATYDLDGTATSTKVDRPIPGSALLKAAWKKDGKQLDLSKVESIRGGERTIKIREQWKLSKDKKVLEIDRTVNTPRGSAKVKMIFDKEADKTGGAKQGITSN